MHLLMKESGRRHFLKEYSDNMEEIFIDKIHNCHILESCNRYGKCKKYSNDNSFYVLRNFNGCLGLRI